MHANSSRPASFCNFLGQFDLVSSQAAMSLLELILFIAVTIMRDGSSVAAQSDNSGIISTSRNNQTTATFDYHVAMLDAVNRERVARGLPRLCKNIKLRNAAMLHSRDMALNDFVSHTGSNGLSMVSRAAAQGYRWTSLAENVAAGQATVGAAMTAWMNSPPHRANILSADNTMFEVGYAYAAASTYKHYWTQSFGSGSTEMCSPATKRL